MSNCKKKIEVAEVILIQLLNNEKKYSKNNKRSSPCFVNLSLFVRKIFFFFWGGGSSILSISLCPSCLFFLFLRPCLIHARMPDLVRVFVHGHTFLHSWSGPMTLVVSLLHGATFLSNFTLDLFVSFIGP